MKKTTLLAAFVACCSFAVNAQKEYKLQYTFKKGDTYEWAQSSTVKQHIAGPGFDQNIESAVKANATMKVIELTSNGAKFEMEYTKLSTSSQQAGINMDSEGDTTKNFPNKALQAIKGKKFNFTINKNGEIESVENTENLWSGMTAKNGFAEAQVAMMKQQLENQLGKNSIKVSLENTLVKYPENKIKVGLTWNNKVETGAPLPLKTDYVWTLESATHPSGVLVGDGQIGTTDTTKVMPLQQGLRATTNFKGRRVERTNINLETGWPESSKSYAEQKGFMMLLAGGQIPEDMKMDVEITTDLESTLKKK
ncbi:MAG: hypothetical protein JST48_03360 [Bacteroidetes bacterium]|nr:hypothetical protein [Bacteroidota bacterium]